MAEDNPMFDLVETPLTASTTAIEGEPTRLDTSSSDGNSSSNDIGAEGLRRRSTGLPPSPSSSSSDVIDEYTTDDASPSISSKKSSPVNSAKSTHDPALIPRQTQDDYYSCNICFDAAIEPVLTLCGHLYCWPCLHQWLDAQRLNPLCPVCKAGCGSDKVIPVYGRDREATDPRLKHSIPDRPAGQRPVPQSSGPGTSGVNGGWQGNTIWNGMMFQQQLGLAAGFGLLPWQFNWFYTGAYHGRLHTAAAGTPISSQQTFISRIFFMFGLLFFIAIVLS